MEISISRLSEDNWKKYREIRLEALRNEPTAFSSSYEEQKDFEDAVWRSRIKYALFALTPEKNPVGLVTIIFYSSEKIKHKVDIIQVYVKPAYRRKGIAGKLFDEALRIVKNNKDVIKINIAVNPEQIPAVRLYKSFGFKKIGSLSKELCIEGTYYDEDVMELII